MARIAFPSYDVQTVNGHAGGVGSFITRFARQLIARGDEVTIIHTWGDERLVPVDHSWREQYRTWGIKLIELPNAAIPHRFPDVWTMRLSERLTPILRDFDLVYFSDWGNVAFDLVRRKRYTNDVMPICVTVLHGPSGWVRLGDREYPIIPDHLHLDFLERYSAHHSDYVVAPTRHIVSWTRRHGWQFPGEPEILGLPHLPEPSTESCPPVARLTRVVFFGRLEKRKGYDIFVHALLRLQIESPDVLDQIEEVVLLGKEAVSGAADWVRETLAATGLRITHVDNLDSTGAQRYLSERVADTLAVVASPMENHPYAVIEASLIPGLNLICTRGGGTPEIFAGEGRAQLFEPTPHALAAKIRERLEQPLAAEELARYDFATANRRWLDFHARALARSRTPCADLHLAPTSATRAVDVCVTFYNKGLYLPQLLESLDIQTFRDFRVIAIDDGSSDAHSIAVFDAMADRYRPRGWLFFRQDNQFVDAARNQAARRSKAEFLLFIDSDDVLARDAIERLVQAARLSGDDCLTPGVLRFSGDAFPYDKSSGRTIAPITGRDMPLGSNLTAAIVYPSAPVFGGPVVLVRRAAFERVGGYREVRDAAHEDWELHARLVLAGCTTDVLPEYLHYYRQVDGSLSGRADLRLAQRRMADTFDRGLAGVGLHGIASVAHATLQRIHELERQSDLCELQLRLSAQRFNTFGLDLPESPGDVLQIDSSSANVASAQGQGPRRRVLVVVPSLEVGGAEMDLVRILPLVDRASFQVVVFTFLARGALAPQLAAAGIEVIGPFTAGNGKWRRRAVRFVRNLFGIFRRTGARSRSTIWRMITAILPRTARMRWRRLKPRIYRSLLPLKRRLAEIVGRVRRSMRITLIGVRRQAHQIKWLVIGQGRKILRHLPRWILSPLRQGLLLSTYIVLGGVLASYVRRRRFDLIHTVLPNAYIVGGIASLASRRPIVMSRLSLNWYQARWTFVSAVERHLLRHVLNIAIGNCNAILHDLHAEGIPKTKLRLLHNGIDVADFSWRLVDREAARERLGVSKTALVLTNVANLWSYKGHEDLLRALWLVRHDIGESVLLIAGRDVDEKRATLEAWCIEHGMGQSVRFLGGRSDIPILLSACDIHISASHTEGLPNNIIEAMCAGVPVIATEVGGVGELVIDGTTGLLVPASDPSALAQAIQRLAENDRVRLAMGMAGHERVASLFSVERCVATLDDIYGELAPAGYR